MDLNSITNGSSGESIIVIRRKVSYLEAAAYPFRAIKYLTSRPRLWLWLILPVVINVTVGLLSWNYVRFWLRGWQAQSAVMVATPWNDWLNLLHSMVHNTMVYFISIFAMIVVGNILIIPFNEWLSEKIDRDLGWVKNEDSLVYEKSATHMLLVTRNELSRMTIFMSMIMPLGFMSLITTAAIFTIPLMLFVTILYLAMDNFSYSLDRRGETAVMTKLSFVYTNFVVCLGFGSGMILMLLIPFLNLIFLPLGAVAATLLYHHLTTEPESQPVSAGLIQGPGLDAGNVPPASAAPEHHA
jgi:CysZ protein